MPKLKKLLKKAVSITPLRLRPDACEEPVDRTDPAGARVHPRLGRQGRRGDGRLFVEDADFINVVGLWWTRSRAIRS